MSKVSFKEMKKGTKKDYLLLDKHEKKFVEGTELITFASDHLLVGGSRKISHIEIDRTVG